MCIETGNHGFFKTPLFLAEHGIQNRPALSFGLRYKKPGPPFQLLKCSVTFFDIADTLYGFFYFRDRTHQ
ncbi:hypothetical protein Q644_04585 [Brucella intermedia 229E]|uniref:Uncharacterized protein n=1 Tax=Brucella intermedia 229E TaxID=1337887 RepID=U4V636_9HYPH|nr:hypothetical protein Q644_04585 [Brucella intermedia 229E]